MEVVLWLLHTKGVGRSGFPKPALSGQSADPRRPDLCPLGGMGNEINSLPLTKERIALLYSQNVN